MSTLGHDLRYGWRSLRRTPGFTFAAVAALALGIGATTTIFTVVNGVLLRPLQYHAPERLANIWNDLGQGAQSLPAVSPLDFRDYQQRSRTFEAFAAAAEGGVANLVGNLTGMGEPERVELVTVTANFFPLLGVSPRLGRQFHSTEEVPNGPHVVMLSHRLWRRRYAGDPGIVGKTIQVDGVAHEVVGVLPPEFRLQLPAEAYQITDADLWAPIQFDYAGAQLPRNQTFFTVFGRLAPGRTFEQAQDEMNRIAEQFRSEFPEHAASKLRIRAVPLQYDVVKHARSELFILLGAVGMVLLIACANVANLLLVRGTTRRAEFALRTALGASRRRMIRQVLTESLLLALAGGALGIATTVAALAVLRSLHPANLPRLADVRLDTTVLLFSVGLCAATAILFGLVPALRAASIDPQDHLKAGARSGTGDRGRARNLLIMGEVALAVVLLVGAGLLTRSFLAMQRVDPGFDGSDVLTFELSMPSGEYPDAGSRRAFLRGLSGRLEALPGVKSVALVSQLPLTGSGPLLPFAYNEETARHWESVTADVRNVSPTYFRTMDAELLAGRTFTDADSVGTSMAIIVDETLAKLAWPGENPIGKRLQIGATGQPNNFAEVIGIVEHMRQHDLRRDVLHQIYGPMALWVPSVITVVVETSTDPASLAGPVRQTVDAMDPDLPVSRMVPMSGYLAEGRAQARFSLALMSVLGGIALVLTAVGVFGVISYSVSQRTREFGIRLALGENPRHTRRSVVFSGMRLVLASIVIGLLGSLVVTRLIAGLLYGVRPADPVTFAATGLLLATVALFACYLPARRATRVDPALALRAE